MLKLKPKRTDYDSIPQAPNEPPKYIGFSIQLALDPVRRREGFERWKKILFNSTTTFGYQASLRWMAARRHVQAQLTACTGIAAAWCPVCGDCICDRMNGGPFDDPDCPLHASDSPHATGKVEP